MNMNRKNESAPTNNRANSNKRSNWLGKLDVFDLFGNKSNNKAGEQSSIPVKPVTNPQQGGVAPAFYQTPANMRQPSEAVMQWATTAGAKMPMGAQMRNVARGGARRRTHRYHKSIASHKHTIKRKTHRRKAHKYRHSRRK
jgi:hypothetical protein